ncbi:MAG: hypothetical protein JSS75_04355 [Bacteroidetes bacterium]|nr:hypothetical protein [Bacteroidota bacterium]
MPTPTDEPLDINIPPPESRGAGMVLIWRCTNCGEIFHLNHAPLPEVCPNCGKDRSYFEQVIED